MENRDGGLKFDDALSFVRPRPWLVDDLGNLKNIEKNIVRIIYSFSIHIHFPIHIPFIILSIDTWKSRLRLNAGNEPHKCAAIFIDNSGVDVILGILPFVEHLLSRGTEV